MDPASPAAADLSELADKYQALAELRVQRDDGTSGARATLRALAARHPGCLRELDTLGLAELSRRARVAREAAGGGAREPWMDWIWAYHRLMRATLVVKRALGRSRRPRPEELPALAAQAREVSGLPLDASFVVAVASPPQRRLAVVVFRLLGELYQRPSQAIADALFPPRRPAPYTLEER